MIDAIRSDRTAVFIDGRNVYETANMLDFSFDYARLRKWLEDSFGTIYRIYYYTAVIDDDNEYSAIRKLTDWLDYNGYKVVIKRAKLYTDGDRVKARVAVDVEMAVDLVTTIPFVSDIVVMSGSASMVRPIQLAMAGGCNVTVISSRDTNPPSAADEMRRVADYFIDLNAIKPLVSDGKHMARPTVVSANK